MGQTFNWLNSFKEIIVSFFMQISNNMYSEMLIFCLIFLYCVFCLKTTRHKTITLYAPVLELMLPQTNTAIVRK